MRTLWLLAIGGWLGARAAAEPVLVPVYKTQGHAGFAAYWTVAPNEVWVAEWSTNLVHWERCTNQQVYDSGLSFTETGTDWTRRFYVRLRKIP